VELDVWLLAFSLKGWDNIAQGNALGRRRQNNHCTLKGCDCLRFGSLFVPALQAGLSNRHETQGVALGYVVPAFQAENQIVLGELVSD
jgi:hypothetical protein